MGDFVVVKLDVIEGLTGNGDESDNEESCHDDLERDGVSPGMRGDAWNGSGLANLSVSIAVTFSWLAMSALMCLVFRLSIARISSSVSFPSSSRVRVILSSYCACSSRASRSNSAEHKRYMDKEV